MRTKTALDEFVLVVPTARFEQIGLFQGLSFDFRKYLDIIEDNASAKFVKRADAEQNPKYKQIIPYAIISFHNEVFSYRRGKLMNESRLLGNYSIGIGGHISNKDMNFFDRTYNQGMRREVDEEIRFDCQYSQEVVAVINDDTDDVGRVHFGVVHLFRVDAPRVVPKEKSINEAKFVDVKVIKDNIEKYENWSRICANELERLL